VRAGQSGREIRVRLELPDGAQWCTVRARLDGVAAGAHDVLLERASHASAGVLRSTVTVR
jgi:hypothetical protein